MESADIHVGRGRMLTRRRDLLAAAGSIGSLSLVGPAHAVVLDELAFRQNEPRSEQCFDNDWSFHIGDIVNGEVPELNDTAWRRLDLPHDWRIEDLPGGSDDGGATADPATFAYTSIAPGKLPVPRRIGPFAPDADPGLDADFTLPPVGEIKIPGGRGQAYTIGGIGWYRKRFAIPPLLDGQRVEVRFDGIYQNADVWLNGTHLGFHPNGYSSFAYDLTPLLKSSAENVLAVRVDCRGKTSRWYSGAGIYRHCWLTVSGQLRVPLWGTRVTTPVVDVRRSVVRIEVKAANGENNAVRAVVRMKVIDAAGLVVGARTTAPLAIPVSAEVDFFEEIPIRDAALWSPDTPTLYRVHIEILRDGKVADRIDTIFGIRSIEFGGQGFLLNGKPVKICGANIHQDNGALGVAAIDRAEERKVQLLKAAGFNAIRGAHNPPSPALLEACDRLGMLFYEEFSDVWDKPKMADDYSRHFAEWWERDLTSMVLRDRNHPSIIIWSIGNEILEDPKGFGPSGSNLTLGARD